MKVKTLLSLCFAAVWLQPGVALAQDSARVPEVSADSRASVDASVDASPHAGTDEHSSQQAQSGSQQNKRKPNTLTKWSPQPSSQQPTTRFQPPQTNKPIPETDRSADSKALFNPLTGDANPVVPSDEQSKTGQDQTRGPVAGSDQLKRRNGQELDSQTAARTKMLDSLNNGAAPSSGRTWNSSISASARSSKPAVAPPHKKSKPPAQSSSQTLSSKPGGSKLNPLGTGSQKRSPLDRKPKSLLDPKTPRN